MIPAPPDEYTAETIWALALVPFLLLVCLVATVIAFIVWRMCHNDDDPDEGIPMGIFIGSATLTVLIGLAFWWGMFPWRAEYHEWRAVSGTVEQVNHRLTSNGDKSMEDKYAVKFAGNRQQYGVLDTRMATVQEGDQLIITCVRRWQWSGTHGYDCNFVDTQRDVAPG